MSQPRILIVEDEPGIADTIRYVLASEGFEPVLCGTGAAALAELATGNIALAVLDVGLPDINGFELFRKIQALGELPVIFLTARSEEIDRVVGLELGADDYIAKPFSPRELAARVRGVLRRVGKVRTTQSEPATPEATPLEIDEERRRIRYYGQALDLSRYEFGLLRTLASRPGRVFSRDELLGLIWHDAESIDRTVDTHVKTLRAKLGAVTPDFDAIVTHRGIGYALAEQLPAKR
ncbi:two-component system response regulator CreB [Uliginosibacterium flavum]|uniref:Two-component system response regulator CreB n=1 Tax=Uliginosibacterium flavum TaxID=1396831 RepID=A0ABV2TLY5_9RHOO